MVDNALLSQLDPVFLSTCLQATDSFARANVLSGRGGPFGASLHILDLDTHEAFPVGGLAANAVLETGLASQHAEAEALCPENQRLLQEKLDLLRRRNRHNLVVLCSSSGQSCPACQAKQEIMARDLARCGLLPKGRFVVTYGATFEDTARIAGFNDAPYVLDNLRRLYDPAAPQGMVGIRHVSLEECPEQVRKEYASLAAHGRAVALLKGPYVLSHGVDERAEDLFATAEVMAIRKACSMQKDMGVKDGADGRKRLDQPWLLGGRPEAPHAKAVLYTALDAVGPLLMAEAQWAGVGEIVLLQPSQERREVPELANHDFARLCWSGYQHPDTFLTVLRVMPFENTAQPAWREELARKGGSILYNGLAAEEALARFTPIMAQCFEGTPFHLSRR